MYNLKAWKKIIMINNSTNIKDKFTYYSFFSKGITLFIFILSREVNIINKIQQLKYE